MGFMVLTLPPKNLLMSTITLLSGKMRLFCIGYPLPERTEFTADVQPDGQVTAHITLSG